jgi:hypothetical protein
MLSWVWHQRCPRCGGNLYLSDERMLECLLCSRQYAVPEGQRVLAAVGRN